MAIAKLSIDLEARLANLQAGLDKAGLLAERQAERMQRAFSGASKALAAVGAGLAAGLSVSVLQQWVNRTIDGIDALNDLADSTGASIENLSALEDVALRTGTSMETAGDAVVKLNKALADAKPDNDVGAAFKALNLSVAELKSLDPVEAFQRVAVALSGFADDANKARLVQELFGKSLKEVAPLLRDVADAGSLQAKVTKEQANEAEKFNKQIFEMQKNLLDLSRTILGPVVKAMNGLFDAFRMSRESGKGLVASMMDIEKIERIVQNNAGTYSNEGRNYPKPSLPSTLPVESKPRSPKAPKAEKQEFVGPEMPDSLSDALKRLEQADENKLARLRAELDQMLSIIQAGGKVPDSALALIAEDIAKLDPAARAAQKEVERLADEQKRLNEILGETPTGKLEALNEKIAFINAQFAAGNIKSAEQWAEAIRTATGTMDNDVKQAAEKGIDAAREMGLTFSSAFEDAIVEGENFRDVLKGLEQDIKRIITRKLVTEPLAEGVTGLLKGSGGGIGGLFSSLFGGGSAASGASAAGGANFAANFLATFGGFFADGGFLAPGKWGIAGERGPEPIFGGRTGVTVQPTGGGAMAVHNNFYLSGPPDRRTQQGIAAASARGVQRALRRGYA